MIHRSADVIQSDANLYSCYCIDSLVKCHAEELSQLDVTAQTALSADNITSSLAEKVCQLDVTAQTALSADNNTNSLAEKVCQLDVTAQTVLSADNITSSCAEEFSQFGVIAQLSDSSNSKTTYSKLTLVPYSDSDDCYDVLCEKAVATLEDDDNLSHYSEIAFKKIGNLKNKIQGKVALHDSSDESDYVPSSSQVSSSEDDDIANYSASAPKKRGNLKNKIQGKVALHDSSHESDYVPSRKQVSSSEDDDIDNYSEPAPKKRGNLTNKIQGKVTLHDSSHESDYVPSPTQAPSSEVDDKLQYKVTVSEKSNTSYFDKKPYCYYCGVQQSHIQRHWFSMHREEREVIHVTGLADKNTRRNYITRLRNLGNHLHNMSVLREGQGELLVTYRSSKVIAATSYVPCEHCFKYLLKKDLYRHRCPIMDKKTKGRVAEKASLLLPPPNGLSAQVQKIICGMLESDIKLIAKGDRLIMDYATNLTNGKGPEKKAFIRDKIREIARFLKEIRKQELLKHITLDECIAPAMFRHCVHAVKSLARFNENTKSYETPSLAIKIGLTLSKVATLVKRNAIECKNDDRIKDVKYFISLCKGMGGWTDEISRHAFETLNDRKRNKLKLEPISDDVKRLNDYLSKVSCHCINSLTTTKSECSIEIVWRRLAEVTLVQLITFNRRRQGEVSKMSLEDFQSRTKVDMSSDAMKALSPLEQSLCKIFTRVEIKGKRGRTVPVLLTSTFLNATNVLIQFRSKAGVRQSNRYLFAVCYSDNHLRGCDALRDASQQCGAKHPETLRSTKLRKHVATLCQVLNMCESEIEMLGQFMGHNMNVHRNYYRLPNPILQTSKLAKIFLLMDSGELTEQQGRTLDELRVDLDEDFNSVGKLIVRQIYTKVWKYYSRKLIMCILLLNNYYWIYVHFIFVNVYVLKLFKIDIFQIKSY